MTDEEFKKTRRELANKIKEVEKEIRNYEYKRNEIRSNEFSTKVMKIMFFSSLSYILFIGGSLLLANTVPVLFSSISAELISSVFISTSLIIGNICNKLYESGKELNNVSKANSEIVGDEIYNSFELETAKNKSKALKDSYIMVNTNKYMVDSVKKNYVVTDIKETSKEKIERNIEKLSISLEYKYRKLNILSKKKILNEKFFSRRDRFSTITKTKEKSMLCGLFTLIAWNLPKIMIDNLLTNSSSVVSIISSFFVGTVVTAGYFIKENIDYSKLFNKVNDELGEYKLPSKNKDAYSEKEEIEKELAKSIKNISLNEYKIQEQKRMLESYNTNYTNESNDLDKSKSKKEDYENKISLTAEDYVSFIYDDIEKNIIEKDRPKVMKKVRDVKINNNDA